MKLVFIHGVGGRPGWRLFQQIEEETELPSIHVHYNDLASRPGWVKEVVPYTAEQIPKEEPHILVGHSFGGLLSLYHQNRFTRALVLLSPVVNINVSLRLTLIAEVVKRGFFYFEFLEPVEMNREDVDLFFKLMKSVPQPLAPFLIVTGEEDRLIDVNAARRLFNASNRREGWYVELSHAGHNFVDREEEVARIVKTFLDIHVLKGVEER